MGTYAPDRRDRGSSAMAAAIGAAFGGGIVPTTSSIPTTHRARWSVSRLFPRHAKPKKDDISGA